MGKERTAEELEVAFAAYSQGKASSRDGLPARLGMNCALASATPALIAIKTPATLLKAQTTSQRSNREKTWEAHLKERNLVAWAELLNSQDMAITAMNEAKILQGITRMPDS